MSKQLQKTTVKDIAQRRVLYLLNLENGRVFQWTALLAVRKNFVDCTDDGVPINPDWVKADHPWVRQQIKSLSERMRFAGANDDTMEDMGRQLTEDAAEKFKSLEYHQAKSYKIEYSDINSVEIRSQANGARIRIYNQIDKSCDLAKAKINLMAREAIHYIWHPVPWWK